MRSIILKALSQSERVHARVRVRCSHKKVAFLHIPKCGGTSIATSIAEAIDANSSGYIDPIRTRKLAQLYSDGCDQAEGSKLLFTIRRALFFDYFMQGKPYIYGHFPTIKECLINSQGYEFVTLLREPTQRFISQFKYYLATKILPTQKFVDRNYVEGLWQDYFCSDLAKFHANIITAYLDDGGSSRLGHLDSTACAVENLKHFSVVGVLEDLTSFTRKFESVVNVPLTIRSVKNKTSDKVDKTQNDLLNSIFTPEKIEDISHICCQDINLYNFSKNELVDSVNS